MSFVVKNYKNGDTLYANDMNNLVIGISENSSAIAQKANAADVYTTQQVDDLVNQKANSDNVYTIEQTDKLLADKANAANVYTKSEVDNKLSAVYEYKGSVATVEDLPENAENGDVYNVEDTGDNYAWNGTAWDKLAGTVDLSNYLTVTAAAEVYLTQENASSQYATKDALQSGLAQKQPVGDYATITQLEDGLALKIDSETASTLFATKDEVEEGLAQKQPVGDYPQYQNFSAGATTDQRKTIQLNNFDSISGLMTNGTGVNLVMVSKWDKADFGSTQLPFNINSKDGVVQINDSLTVVDNKQLEAAIADFTTASDVDGIVDAAIAPLVTNEALSSAVSTLNTQFTAALEEKANVSDVYLKSAADTKFALKSDIPTALPNPNALTIKYNGVQAFVYDGSSAETGNFVVTADTVPGIQEKIDASLESYAKTADLTAYALKTELDSYALKTDLNGFATQDQLTQYALKTELPEIPEALPNPEALTIKYNGQEAFSYDGSRAETGNFVVNLETVPVSKEDATSAKDYIDSKAIKAVYNLGNFATSGQAENAAAADDVYNNKEYSLLVYTTDAGQNGQIINTVSNSNKTTQRLYLDGTLYTRTIAVVDGEKQVSAWALAENFVALPKRSVLPSLFSLTTDAESDTIKAAMTDAISNESITLDDLNKCLQYGYTLREYSMQAGSIFVGFSGQGFTLTYVGFANPSQDPAIMSIIIDVTADGQYSVLRNGTRAIALTSNNIASNSVITKLSDSVSSLESSTTSDVALLKTQLQILQDQVQQIKTPSIEDVEITQEAASVSEPDKDVAFNGVVDSYAASIIAKSIQSNNAMIESGRLAAKAEAGDVSIKNLSTSGNLDKSVSNAGLSVDTDEYVTINAVNWQQSGYNAIEVGLSSAPKSVLIDGIDFAAAMSNNAISVFDWQENAVITISNCHFADVSNALRISNRGNKPATLNIINCSVDKWTEGEYAGFICMQDFTSGSAEAAKEANQFGKLTINFINTTGPNGMKIVGNAQQLVENHQIYLYTDWEGIVNYSEDTASRFPQIVAK